MSVCFASHGEHGGGAAAVRQRPLAIHERLLSPAQPQPRLTPHSVGGHAAGLPVHHQIAVLDGLGEVTHAEMHLAPDHERLGTLRVQAQGLLAILQSLLQETNPQVRLGTNHTGQRVAFEAPWRRLDVVRAACLGGGGEQGQGLQRLPGLQGSPGPERYSKGRTWRGLGTRAQGREPRSDTGPAALGLGSTAAAATAATECLLKKRQGGVRELGSGAGRPDLLGGWRADCTLASGIEVLGQIGNPKCKPADQQALHLLHGSGLHRSSALSKGSCARRAAPPGLHKALAGSRGRIGVQDASQRPGGLKPSHSTAAHPSAALPALGAGGVQVRPCLNTRAAARVHQATHLRSLRHGPDIGLH
mmetsp:Transcript_122647/g.392639  ORF Transcript_122647/g.392639 Transcript_122647/m.392639 type:complete len:360 (+) Transcript_122647:680-1759(+)